MTTFYLVRHAHSDWTPDEARGLSTQGRASALLVADLLGLLPIKAVYSSPYARARQTVEPLAEHLGLPIGTVDELRERELGQVGTPGWLEAVKATWQDFSLCFPGGESSTAAQQRGVAALRALQVRHPSEAIVVATHGNLLALILRHYDASVDFGFWKALTLPDVYELGPTQSGGIAIRRLWPAETA